LAARAEIDIALADDRAAIGLSADFVRALEKPAMWKATT